MASIPHTEQFNTVVSLDEASQRFSAYHSSKGGKVMTTPDGALEGTTGSKVGVRILGAFLVSRSWWPLKTTVRFTQADDGTSVEMTVADNFGFGFRTGLKAKYEALIHERAAEVKGALS